MHFLTKLQGADNLTYFLTCTQIKNNIHQCYFYNYNPDDCIDHNIL